MKNLILSFCSLIIVGSLFQACDNTKTYAEMLDEEKDAVNSFIKENKITVISKDEFEKDTITDLSKNEYVAFSNGVYMQIVERGDFVEKESKKLYSDTFGNNDNICVRYVEVNMASRDTVSFNVVLPGFEDAPQTYMLPAVFRYVAEGDSKYGTFTEMNYLWSYYYGSSNNATAVPAGWLLALPYLTNNSHVRLIIPSKMGHDSSQQYVKPYFYDIRSFQKAQS